MKLYHKNPRQITKQQYQDLEAWLGELGDLSGIVHDLNSDEIPAGNQRSRIFGLIKDGGNIVITERLDEPTPQGTVARGYVEWRGEQFGYRQVRWTPEQCEKANIIANKAGGDFDYDMLANEFDLGNLLEWGFESWELVELPIIDDGELATQHRNRVALHQSNVVVGFGRFAGLVLADLVGEAIEAIKAAFGDVPDAAMTELCEYLNESLSGRM